MNASIESCKPITSHNQLETNFDDELIKSQLDAIDSEKCLMRSNGEMNPAAITNENYYLWVLNELMKRWSINQDSNRKMREYFAKIVFGLVALILLIDAGVIVAVGMGYLKFTEDMLKWIVGSFGVQMIGAFVCIVKYLFSKDDTGVNKMFELLSNANNSINK